MDKNSENCQRLNRKNKYKWYKCKLVLLIKMKVSWDETLQREFYQTLRRVNIIFLKLFQKLKREGTLPKIILGPYHRYRSRYREDTVSIALSIGAAFVNTITNTSNIIKNHIPWSSMLFLPRMQFFNICRSISRYLCY